MKIVDSTQLKRALAEWKTDLQVVCRMPHRNKERERTWRTGVRDMGGGKGRPSNTSCWISRHVRERGGQGLNVKRWWFRVSSQINKKGCLSRHITEKLYNIRIKEKIFKAVRRKTGLTPEEWQLGWHWCLNSDNERHEIVGGALPCAELKYLPS